MKMKKIMALVLTAAMTLSLAACGSGKEDDVKEETTQAATVEEMMNTDVVEDEAAGYEYGAGVTFHSEEPVVYSMMFSDHENYPYQESWRLFSRIEELTNVTFDLTLIARTDYEDKKSVLVNSGDSPYIIPKTYEENAYVNGGQVVAVSDWVQYMPNYQKCVQDWGMVDDLKVKLKSDGKYYVLPGLWENAGAGYSYIIRKDVFEAAGVDITELEKNWTYEDFYEAMKKVKEYTGCDYVFSDRHKGESTLNIAAVSYGVTAGWGVANGMKFDQESNQFYFAETTDNFKEFVSYFNKLLNEKIMDPESFSQDDDAALSKFYRGETYVINGNYQNLADITQQMQVEDAELYMVVQPGGPAGNLQIENSRLENGIMISQNALDDLGEEEFIKMLRFIDWLWYSEEGQTLCLWGVEGETYTRDGESITLHSDITFNGINPGAAKQLNADYGFGGGVFAYGGPTWLKVSKYTEGEKDYSNRVVEYKDPRPVDPPIMGNEEETEEMDLIKTPLIDSVKSWTLKFITGQANIETDWEAYVSECESLRCKDYEAQCNEIFDKTKSMLGY